MVWLGASFGTSVSRAGVTLVWLAALAASLAAAPATAQETETAQSRAAIVLPLSLSKAADLDFGKVSYTGAGTVVLTPTATPTCTVTGGAIHYGTCTAAVFQGYGQSGRTVRIKLPGAGGITLAGPAGATMQVSAVTTDATPTLGPPLTGNATSNGFRRYRILSGDGAFEFRIGGTLIVAAGQRLGLYSANFNVEIAYE